MYYLGAILGQYLLLFAIWRDTSAAKEAINTLKEWKEDAAKQIRALELDHAKNHGGSLNDQ
jgi:hypothetical protein